jgi:TadE-like protein
MHAYLCSRWFFRFGATRFSRRPRSQRDHERGTTTVELVALAPLLAALMLFVVFCGRVAVTRNTVARSARDAARAASISLTREDAEIAFRATLMENLGANFARCTYLPVDYSAIGTDTGEPGDWDSGVIEVRLTCEIPTRDLGLLGLAGTKTFTAVAIEPVDTWRSRRVNS